MSGSTATAPICKKTAAGEEYLRNLGEYRVSAAVSDIVAMFFLNMDLRGLPIAASCHWPRGKGI